MLLEAGGVEDKRGEGGSGDLSIGGCLKVLRGRQICRPSSPSRHDFVLSRQAGFRAHQVRSCHRHAQAKDKHAAQGAQQSRLGDYIMLL